MQQATEWRTELTFEDDQTISVSFVDGETFDTTMDHVIPIPIDYRDQYRGPYDVTPSFNAQTLETKEKVMVDNVTVDGISVSRVSNPSGGNTVYIGGTCDA